MKKNSVQLLFILCIFLVSFNIFAKSTSFKADSILFTKTIPFENLPENIEQDMKNGSMNYLKNQQCLISTYRTFYKDSTLDHINIYATCMEVNPDKKINWDYPQIPNNAEIKTIHVLGKNYPKSLLNDLKKGKSTFFGEKLAYYKPSHKNYKQNEYFYSK